MGIISLIRLHGLERRFGELAAKVKSLEARARVRDRGTPEGAQESRELRDEIQPLAADAAHDAQGTAPPDAMGASVESHAKKRVEPPAHKLDLESLIAGRLLNRVGIVAMLLAAAFFLKFAFENDWVGPTGRVVIGLFAGTAFLVMSQRMFGKGYTYFSEGMAALGGGVLFLSIFAAWDFYDLIPVSAAFASLVMVTAALGGLALGRDSERLAVLALGAGFVTPGLLGTDDQIPLFAFLATLVACFLYAAWIKGWHKVAPAGVIGALIYLFGWFTEHYSKSDLTPTLIFVTIFFAEFAAYLLLRARFGPSDDRRPRLLELLLIPLNAGWYGFFLFLLLYNDHRIWLTLSAIALGAIHLWATRMITTEEPSRVSASRLLYAGLALTFVTAAIPIQLEGRAITIAWAIEGALLVWAGFRAEVGALRVVGVALLGVVVAMLFNQHEATDKLFLNARFLSFATVVAALGLATWWARSRWDELDELEQRLFGLVAIAANAVGVWALSEEIWFALGRQPFDFDLKFARQMSLSVLWILAASLLIALGAKLKVAALRWQGLVMLGITVVKVFILDLSFLDRAYRIGSFLVLSVVLLAVSFWYQKNMLGAAEDEASDGSEAGRDQA
jgi:uncharacterized membrane protein